MASWIYKRTAHTTHMDQVDEVSLQRMIRANQLTGVELVRPAEGPGEWVPIHTLPVFRETLGLPAGVDASRIASGRKGRHVAAAVGVVSSLGLAGFVAAALSAGSQSDGTPGTVVAMVLGFAVTLMVAGGVSFALANKARTGQAKKGETIQAPAARPNRIDEVERALAALEAALKSAPDSLRAAIPVSSLQESARRLKRNRELLSSLPAEEARQALTAELEATRARAAATTDSGVSDAFADQIRGIEAHLRSIDGAASAIAETEARARALLHEVEALRVDVLRAGTDSGLDDELLERLHTIRRALEAESAIEEQLSRSAPAQRALGPATKN